MRYVLAKDGSYRQPIINIDPVMKQCVCEDTGLTWKVTFSSMKKENWQSTVVFGINQRVRDTLCGVDLVFFFFADLESTHYGPY